MSHSNSAAIPTALSAAEITMQVVFRCNFPSPSGKLPSMAKSSVVAQSAG
jgi:hypothetical protein